MRLPDVSTKQIVNISCQDQLSRLCTTRLDIFISKWKVIKPNRVYRYIQDTTMSPVTPLVGFVTVVVMTTVVSAEIFTSSLKVERMVMEEEQLLREFKRYIDIQYDKLKGFSNFYSDRLREVRLRQRSDIDLKHPNSVYKIIKRFATVYADVLGDHFESFRVNVDNSDQQFLSDGNDIRGARLSLLRLQNVYNLNAMDMARGDYLGYQGPQLEMEDAYEIAQTAFTEGKLNESLEWLNVSLTLYNYRNQKHDVDLESSPSLGAIKALLGRVHLFNGSPHLAEALYYEAKKLDPTAGDVQELDGELVTQPRADTPTPHYYFRNFSRLCSLENRHHPAESKEHPLVCRYRETVLPYYRFQEEILSVVPFASVFYHVISDEEGNQMKNFVQNKLVRGRVGVDDAFVSDVRTGDLAWIYDGDSTAATSVATRIEHITGLDTSQRLPDGPSSGEAFQVVNYGLGGHYDVHMDPFETATTQKELQFSGERIATFLIYLSDVERGGSTVFTRVGMSVAPVKNMALFWYSYTPAHQRDDLTYHAGCPVLIGQKWIVNKWIWTYGNTFRRRCGLRPDATQLDIEPDMRRGYT